MQYFLENREMIERLLAELNIQISEQNPQSAIEQADSSFAKELHGKSFCVTGSFESISREEIHEIVEKNGGEIRSSVSAKLDYLIV